MGEGIWACLSPGRDFASFLEGEVCFAAFTIGGDGQRRFLLAMFAQRTSDLDGSRVPTKMAPGSMERVPALTSPTISALALISTRSVQTMFPWTLP